MKAFCTKCAQEVQLPDAAAGSSVHCPACGASFTPEEPKSCPHCSAPNRKNAIRCEKCGMPMLTVGLRKPCPAPATTSDKPQNAETTQSIYPAIGLKKPIIAHDASPVGGPPKLSLTVPAASVERTKKADDRDAGTAKQETEVKAPLRSGKAKKTIRIAIAVSGVLLILCSAGFFIHFILEAPSDPQGMLTEAEKSLKAGNTEKAIRLLEKSAKLGNHHAAALLGDMYLKGEGVSENLAKALVLFMSAESDPLAHFRLGQLYAEGKGLGKNFTEAAKHFAAAAKGGYPDAEIEYAKCYAEGLDLEKDDRKALPWRKKRADEGNVEAQLAMAGYYINGVFVDHSVPDAIHYLTLAAEQGSRAAQYQLAEFALKGIWTGESEQEAKTDFARLYQEITEDKGGRIPDDSDLVVAAKCLINGCGTKEPDPEQAEKILAGPAERGNPEAILLLYKLTENGDAKKILLEKALALNNPEAKEITAIKIAETDPTRAERLLKEAQDQGSISAYAAAAMILWDKDPKRAFEASAYACERGNPQGALLCAKCLETGHGTKKDFEQAFEIYWDLASSPSPAQPQAHAKMMEFFRVKETRDELDKLMQDRLKNGTQEEKQAFLKMQAGLYLFGIGVQKDTSKAVDCLWEAKATYELARLLEKGIEPPKIVSLLLKEDNINDSELLYTLAKILRSNGKEIPADPVRAAALLKKAAAANHPQAAYEMGCLYAQEKAFDLPEPDRNIPDADIEKSPAKAMTLFKQAAEAGHIEAQYRYARAILHAKALPENVKDKYAEAGIWLKKAAGERYVPAVFLYAMFCLDSGKVTRIDCPEILQMLRYAAEAGYPPAMFALGDVAAKAGNREAADTWYEKASAKNFVPALIQRRQMKDNFGWIREAAAEGYLPAQAEEALALLRKERKENSPKKSEAIRKLEQLCELGYTAGLNELGVAAYGRDKRAALKIFKKAEAEGSACALFNLGVYTYREENIGGGNYQNVKEILEKIRKSHPEFKRIPEGLDGELDRRMRLESEFRRLNAANKALLKKYRQNSSYEAKKELEKNSREIDAMRNDLDAVTASLKKSMDWIFESDYVDFFRKAPPKFRYPWIPAPDLSPLKDVWE